MIFMKRKRTVVIAAAVAAACAVALSALTLGFLGDSTGIANKFIIGHNKSTVEEEDDNYSQTTNLKDYKKEVTVKNEDNVPCYVRVYMDFSNSVAEGKSKLSNKAESQAPTDDDFYKNSAYKTALAAATNTVAEKWFFIPESDVTDGTILGGYYYYAIPIDPDKSTDTLIKQVRVDNGTNADTIKDFNILVYSETVRSDDDAPDWSKLSNAEKAQWVTKAKDAWKAFLTIPTVTP